MAVGDMAEAMAAHSSAAIQAGINVHNSPDEISGHSLSSGHSTLSSGYFDDPRSTPLSPDMSTFASPLDSPLYQSFPPFTSAVPYSEYPDHQVLSKTSYDPRFGYSTTATVSQLPADSMMSMNGYPVQAQAMQLPDLSSQIQQPLSSDPNSYLHSTSMSRDLLASDPEISNGDLRMDLGGPSAYASESLTSMQNTSFGKPFSPPISSLSTALDMTLTESDSPIVPASTRVHTSGYVTPVAQLEPPTLDRPPTLGLGSTLDNVNRYADDGQAASMSSVDLVREMLRGISLAVHEADEALLRGEGQAVTLIQNMYRSMDLMRSLGVAMPPPPSRSISDQSISTRSAASSTAPISRTQSTSPIRSTASSDAVNGSSPLSHLSHAQSQPASTSFAQFLDIADPSRKRTISSATAQASEADRATKSQKRSPPEEPPGIGTASYFASQSAHSDPSQTPIALAPSALDEYDASLGPRFAPLPASWPDNATASSSDTIMDGVENSSGMRTDLFSASGSSAGMKGLVYPPISPTKFTFAPPPPATRSVRASRASSYTGAHPFSAPSAPNPPPMTAKEELKMEETMQSLFGGGIYSRAPSRAPSPDSSGSESDNDADGDWSRSSSRRSSRGVHVEPRFARRVVSAGDQALDPETKEHVDQVFMMYLQRICSHLDATDSKGEQIHQTLMAKKMAKMDESPDFRPFKFRIQAFTNAFMDDLALHPSDATAMMPLKKIKAYLWHQQPYISRFNEDGKKSKSKGNHVWQVEARKAPEGGWVFRKFQRKIVGSPPPVAHVGVEWSWQPRIWDPQVSRSSINVSWSSPLLPSWLSWKGDNLKGTPGPDIEEYDITVEGQFHNEIRDPVVMSFHLQVMSQIPMDPEYMPRRPSIAGEGRRIASDGALLHAKTNNPIRPLPRSTATSISLPQAPSPPTPSADTSQVIQVVTDAAHRVAHAQNQAAGGLPVQLHRQAALAKQQQVLAVTAQALNEEARLDAQGSSMEPGDPVTTSSVLAKAAHEVVHEVARQVAADRSALHKQTTSRSSPTSPPPPVSLKEVSVATQTAVAQAVAMTNPLSTEVEVMMTANALIQQQGRSGGPLLQPQIPDTIPEFGAPTPTIVHGNTPPSLAGLSPPGSQPFPSSIPPPHSSMSIDPSLLR